MATGQMHKLRAPYRGLTQMGPNRITPNVDVV